MKYCQICSNITEYNDNTSGIMTIDGHDIWTKGYTCVECNGFNPYDLKTDIQLSNIITVFKHNGKVIHILPYMMNIPHRTIHIKLNGVYYCTSNTPELEINGNKSQYIIEVFDVDS